MLLRCMVLVRVVLTQLSSEAGRIQGTVVKSPTGQILRTAGEINPGLGEEVVWGNGLDPTVVACL